MEMRSVRTEGGAEEIILVTSYVLTAKSGRALEISILPSPQGDPVASNIVPHHEEEIVLLRIV